MVKMSRRMPPTPVAALEVYARGLVGAVFTPHNAVDAELGEPGLPAQGGYDALILFGCNAVLGEKFRRYRD
jgi:hypothetical protein